MKRGLGQFSVWASAFGLCLGASAATDPFLQLSSPILTNGQVQFTLTGESGVSYVIKSSTNAQYWTPVLTNADHSITRSITLPAANDPEFYRAWRYPLPRFPGAITARQNIDFKGNSVYFDSFDSADPTKSTNGNYDPSKAQANGDIASELGLTNIGNAGIHGRLKVGQSGSYSLGPNGFIGPIGWNGPGVFSQDWIQTDFRFAFPDVPPPYNTGFSPPPGTGTNYWILANGDYYVAGGITLNNKIVLVIGNARLYVTGNFLMGGSLSELKVIEGATFQLFVGQTAGTNGFATITRLTTPASSDATAFQYSGLPSNTSVVCNGNDGYKKTIYAPQAVLTMGGGGSTVFDYQGAVVANLVVLNGHFNFHFDENLKKKEPQR